MRRILFLGQKILGEKCFHYLKSGQFRNLKVVAVSSNKDTAKWWGTNQIYLDHQDLVFINNSKRNDKIIQECIEKNKIDTIISVQHPWILRKETLEKVKYNAYNLHCAKLPEYKGNKICSHVILNNEKYHYSTIHMMSKKVDMGDIIFEEKYKIHPSETAETLYQKGNEMSFKLFKKLLNYLDNGIDLPRKKIKNKGTFFSINSLKDLKKINDTSDFDEVDRKSRAFLFNGFEPSYFILNKKKFFVIPDSKNMNYE